VAKKTKEQILTDAREAKRLLADEALTRVFDELQQEIWDQFRSVSMGDVDDLMRVQAEQHGLDVLRRRLQIHVDAGVIAEKGAKS
jgi:vacuolar-type H+-ATPase subunit H